MPRTRRSPNLFSAGMNTTNQLHASERIGLDANGVADLLDISVRHLWKLHAGGQIPEPIRLGRSVRWNRVELLAWIEAGAPPRNEWEAQKASVAR